MALRALIVALAALALAAGCGGDEAGDVSSAATSAASEATSPDAGQGDPTAGKQVFSDAGCAGCHTLADAGATGTRGPNLDELQPSYEQVVQQVTTGGGGMPSFADQLSPTEINDVAAYVSENAGQ